MLEKITIAILCAILGFALGVNSKEQTPIESCDFNITGQVQEISNGNLFKENKQKVSIQFNGIEAVSGMLNEENSGSFVGSHKGQKATAQCSGPSRDNISCLVEYNGKTSILKFTKDKK